MTTRLELPTGRLIAADPSRLFGDAGAVEAVLPVGSFPVSVGAGTAEVSFGTQTVSPRAMSLHGFDTPSGYACLLDQAALDDFTDLGDEPVDEYELLLERLRAAERGEPLPGDEAGVGPGDGLPLDFRGILVFPAGSGVREIALDEAEDGSISRLVLTLQEPVAGNDRR